MNRWVPVLSAAFAVLLPTALAHAQTTAVVERWNRVMRESVVAPGANPPTVFVHRPMAIVSIAVFDALNSFDRVYRPAVAFVEVPPNASREAAVAQAAHDTLVALLPILRDRFASELAASVAGLDEESVRRGARTGAAAAQAALDSREVDGWARKPPAYELPNLAGYWRPTPPANQAATFTHYPDVEGFVINNGRRFLMEAPPSLRSDRYATDLNEVKALGAANSQVRTAEQTQMARLWHGVGTTTTSPNLWNLVLIDTARARGWEALDLARGLALMNVTQHDALLTSFTGKFLYGFWRPITAIREADRDDNPATEADPNWTSLLSTPPYPSHPGNRACLSASQARLLERLFGTAPTALQVTWEIPNASPVTRAYNSFRQLADEEARSRIWGGIHFQFESLASTGSCTLLADYVVDNMLRQR